MRPLISTLPVALVLALVGNMLSSSKPATPQPPVLSKLAQGGNLSTQDAMAALQALAPGCKIDPQQVTQYLQAVGSENGQATPPDLHGCVPTQ